MASLQLLLIIEIISRSRAFCILDVIILITVTAFVMPAASMNSFLNDQETTEKSIRRWVSGHSAISENVCGASLAEAEVCLSSSHDL